MKRLLGFAGLTCLVVLTACFYFGSTLAWLFFVFGLILLVASLLIPQVRKGRMYPIFFMLVAVASCVFIVHTVVNVESVQNRYEPREYVEVEAVLRRDMYTSYGYNCYELSTVSINGENIRTGLILRSDDVILTEIGDTLRFSCEMDKVTNATYLSKGICFESYIFQGTPVEISAPDVRPLTYYVSMLRRDLMKNLYMELDYDTASFASAVMMGDKYALEEDVKGLFRICGISHIAVVSGLHLSLITSIIRRILRAFVKNQYVVGILTIIGMFSFAALSGFGIPVIRSAVMLTIFTIGDMIGRKSDSLNSVGAAAIIILLINPYSVGDIGMLLSFSCILGIVLWGDKISAFFMRGIDKFRFSENLRVRSFIKLLVDTVSMSVCASIWTLPITILCFGGTSLISVVANLFIVPLMSIVLFCIGMCALTHYISFLPLICDTFAFVVSVFYDYMIFVCSILSELPFAYVQLNEMYHILWLFATLFMIGIVYWIGNKKYYKIVAFVSVVALLVCSLAHLAIRESKITLFIPDVSNGYSVILEGADGYALLQTKGEKIRIHTLMDVVNDLPQNGNNVLITDCSNYSTRYTEKLTNQFDYECVLRYDNTVGPDEDYYPVTESEVVFDTDRTLYLWDNVTIQLICAPSGLFYYVTAGEETMLIIPEFADCAELDELYRTPDIIVTEGVGDNMQLLSCDTLIVPGNDYMSHATAEILAPITYRIVTGEKISYDIKIN